MNSEIMRVHSLEAHALWASTYDRQRNPVLQLEERIVDEILVSTRHSTVLDLGCGTGRWLAKFAQEAGALGMDVSLPMLRRAQEREGLAEHLIQADCRAIPVRAGSMELGILSFCLGYVRDVCEVAREVARVVQPEGHAIVSDFHPSARARGWTRSFRSGAIVVEIQSFDHSISHVCECFAREGFELVRCLEPRFSDADRPAFEQRGREDLFAKVVGEAAIFVCLFKRMRQSPTVMRDI